jgi:hypothetical protein
MLYKFLDRKGRGIVSRNGDQKWKVGEWYKCEEKLDMCNVGFHASPKIYQAFSYIQGSVVAKVEVRGKHKSQDDKEVWEEMRIIEAKKWTKKDSVALAIFSAELVIENYEKECPGDDRPRKAIEAAKKVLENDTAKNRSAASAARSVASAAASAASAARSAIVKKIDTWMTKRYKELENI